MFTPDAGAATAPYRLDFEIVNTIPGALRLEGTHSPETPAPVCALIVTGAAKSECTDLAALFLSFDASDMKPRVDARQLHQFVEVGKRFTSWITERKEAAGFVKGEDISECEGLSLPESGSSKSRPQKTKEYSPTMNMAKHLALLERNAQDETVRRYYIALRQSPSLTEEEYRSVSREVLAHDMRSPAPDAAEDGEKVVQSVADISLERVCRIPVPAECTTGMGFAVVTEEEYFKRECRPETPVPVCALVVPDGPKTECTDLAALFLPVTAGEEEPWVDARRLHEALGSKRHFSDWVKRRAKECQLVENEDYGVCSTNLWSKENQGRGGHNAKEYWLTMDAAKGFSMMERNAQGKLCRDYFVACEKELQRRQRAELVPAIELKQSKDGSTYLAGLLGEQAVKTVTVEAALKEATDRATKAEQALGDAVIQPGLAATVSAMGINLETEKLRANHWEAAARNWEAAVIALNERMETMVPRLIPTDTMSMTGFVNAYPELGLGRNQLTTFLRARGVLYTGPHKNGGIEGQIESLLITSHIDSGNCGCKPTERGFTNADAEPYTKQFLGPAVTPKGLPWLLKEIETYGFRWCIAR